jgi:DNA mismatch repair ATPase MutS
LYDLEEIAQRQEAVEFFLQRGELAQQLRQSLK